MAKLLLVFSFLIFSALVFNIQGQTNAVPRRGTIRLVRNGIHSPSYTSGRVQIYLSSWGHICDDIYFAFTEAHVICHQQGYTGATSYSRASSDLSVFGLDTVYPITLDNVDCSTPNYLTILQCGYSTSISSSCVHGSDDVSVTCFTIRIWNSPYDGQIRLQGSLYTNQGLVEVYCNGQWGTVCDDSFDQIDANTVCRQLGYTRATAYDNLSLQGSSSQPIWLDDVLCTRSSYSCLRSCQRCPSRVIHDCRHSEDITVECDYVTGSSSTMITTCDFGTSPSGSTSSTGGTTYDPTNPITGHTTTDPPFTVTNQFIPSTSGISAAAIAGIVVAVVCLVCVCLPIIIAVCVAGCIFIGNSRKRRPAARVVTTAASPPTTSNVSNASSKNVDYPEVAAYPSVPYNTTQHPTPPAYAGQPPPPYPAQPQTSYPVQRPDSYPAQQPAPYQTQQPAPYPTHPPAHYPAQPPASKYPAQDTSTSYPVKDTSAPYPPQPLNESYPAPPQAPGYSEEPPPYGGYDGSAYPPAPYPQ